LIRLLTRYIAQKEGENMTKTNQEITESAHKKSDMDDLQALLTTESDLRILSEMNLFLERERLKIVLSAIGDGVIAVDAQGRVAMLNGHAKGMTGWAEDSAVGHPFDEVFDIVDAYSGEKIVDFLRIDGKAGDSSGLSHHILLRSQKGVERPITDYVAPIIDPEGALMGTVVVFRDITEEEMKRRETEFLSYHDPLTGLGNRRYFENQIRRMERIGVLPLTVIMADINCLKLTNDTFGQEMGDRLLQKAAEVIQSCCRSSDVICRHGGDEFVILLPNTLASEAEIIADDIRSASARMDIGFGPISLSIGWTVRESSAERVVDTFKRAEDNMYQRKFAENAHMQDAFVQNIMNKLRSDRDNGKMRSNVGSDMATALAKAMQLSLEEVFEVQSAYALRDIGEIAIDADIFARNGPLTEEEWVIVRRHPEIGYRILRTIPMYADIAVYVLYHQERWDGTGYPQQLKGIEIPLFARIMAVADAYEAMISPRPYREALAPDAAGRDIAKNAGTQFDPEIARVFVENVIRAK
jgi:diguanylate cyclase (GGDEF)-like protein/PAS domain S-box-containing protein